MCEVSLKQDKRSFIHYISLLIHNLVTTLEANLRIDEYEFWRLIIVRRIRQYKLTVDKSEKMNSATISFIFYINEHLICNYKPAGKYCNMIAAYIRHNVDFNDVGLLYYIRLNICFCFIIGSTFKLVYLFTA